MEKLKKYSLIEIAQLLVITIGVGGVFINIGKLTATVGNTTDDLASLTLIVQDLVKAQIQISSNDARHTVMLEDLRQRVIELERKN